MPDRGVLSIREWRERKLAGDAMPGRTPLEIADEIEKHANETLKLASVLRPKAGDDKELRSTLGDLTAMAHLGNYYAEKIRAAADLGLFDKTGDATLRDSAVKRLHSALLHWSLYSRAYTSQYRQPLLYNRVGWVDIPALTQKVEEDIGIAKLWTPGTVADAPAEERESNPAFRK